MDQLLGYGSDSDGEEQTGDARLGGRKPGRDGPEALVGPQNNNMHSQRSTGSQSNGRAQAAGPAGSAPEPCAPPQKRPRSDHGPPGKTHRQHTRCAYTRVWPLHSGSQHSYNWAGMYRPTPLHGAVPPHRPHAAHATLLCPYIARRANRSANEPKGTNGASAAVGSPATGSGGRLPNPLALLAASSSEGAVWKPSVLAFVSPSKQPVAFKPYVHGS